MKIIIDISYLQKKSAGYGSHTTELINSLLEYDKTNEYILWGWSFSLDEKIIKGFNKENVKIKIKKIPGAIKRFYFNKLKFLDFKFIVGNFDIFHGIEPLLPPIKNEKIIITIHDLAYKKYPEFFLKNILRMDKVISENVKISDAIIVPSEQTKQDVVDLFNISESKIRIIRLPVNRMFFNPIDDALSEEIKKKYRINFPFILFVGTIEPRKNIPFLIKAFEIYHSRIKSNLNLVLAGKLGWLYKEILSSIENSNVRNKIHYLNYLPFDELVTLYKLSKYFVYPSFYEGYGFPVLEAMASGKAVITTDTSSLKEIAKDAGIFIEPSNVEQLVEAITKLDEDDNFRELVARKCFEKALNFDRKEPAENILKLYSNLFKF